ncbi:MAG: VWA-like domain-containing protein, partial [Campylobacterota bacterium]|nr:VWA-like domain-containing protein [Campylobacterota bacterium]
MIEKKLSQAKAKLLAQKPYFGTLAANLKLEAVDNHHAFRSDGVLLQYNLEYFQLLSIDELGFVLSNGAMHAALSHDNRQKDRLTWLWQEATDYAINSMLVQNGLELPEYANYERRFEGMYAEEIYEMLKDQIDNHDEADTMQEPQESEEQAKESVSLIEEEQFEQLMHQALEKADSQGELPEGIERFVRLSHRATIDWREQLHHALDRHYRNDYRMIPPSKKLLYAGIYLPSLYSERLSLVVAIDSSGSIDEVMLASFIDELEALLLSFNDVYIELLICDDRIRTHQSIQSGEPIEYQLIGAGGTSFIPVFEYI